MQYYIKLSYITNLYANFSTLAVLYCHTFRSCSEEHLKGLVIVSGTRLISLPLLTIVSTIFMSESSRVLWKNTVCKTLAKENPGAIFFSSHWVLSNVSRVKFYRNDYHSGLLFSSSVCYGQRYRGSASPDIKQVR